MNPKYKKFISVFLIFSLPAFSGNLYAKERKHGAELVIQKKDGQQIRGELIAVKQKSLLLLDSKSAIDVSIDIEDIKVITIVKKSRFWRGAGYRALIGGSAAILSIPLTDGIRPGRYVGEGLVIIAYLLAGVLGGIAGGLIGRVVGALALKNERSKLKV